MARRRPRRRRTAFACCTAVSSRSAPTGRSTFPDDLLAAFDVVVASVHVSPPAEGGADAADAERDQQPPRRHRRPPVGADDPDPGRSRPRLGGGLRRRGRDRHRPGDERLAASPRPFGRARPTRRRGRLHILTVDSDAHYIRELEYVRWGHLAGSPGWVEPAERPQHAIARGPAAGMGRRKARSHRRPGRLSPGTIPPCSAPSPARPPPGET